MQRAEVIGGRVGLGLPSPSRINEPEILSISGAATVHDRGIPRSNRRAISRASHTSARLGVLLSDCFLARRGPVSPARVVHPLRLRNLFSEERPCGNLAVSAVTLILRAFVACLAVFSTRYALAAPPTAGQLETLYQQLDARRNLSLAERYEAKLQVHKASVEAGRAYRDALENLQKYAAIAGEAGENLRPETGAVLTQFSEARWIRRAAREFARRLPS